MYTTVLARLKHEANPEDAKQALRFFKSGPGEYGEGDKFLGIRNPVLHQLVKEFKHCELSDIEALLTNEYHEARHLALLMMVRHFARGTEVIQEAVYHTYLARTNYINNWDLVDCSSYKIVGPYLLERDRSVLYSLANSPSLWERRIAMVSTYCFIKAHDFVDVIQLATLLKNDTHDLMHKAVGWMLREAGNRNNQILLDFLNAHYQTMPRTALRYAIEKLPEDMRQDYLKGRINAR